MKTLEELKKEIYNYHHKNYSYIFDEWKWYSYRKLKAKFYMETAAVLVYLLMKTKVKPNTITIAYILLGLFGGIFLAIPLKLFVLIGIILFYFRPILDWGDGLYARETNQTSLTGTILDNYGALIGWVALWVGFGFYIVNKSTGSIIIYLIPLIPALFALDIMRFSRSVLFMDYSAQRVESKNTGLLSLEYNIENDHPLVSKIVRSFNQLFEHNARTVDIICFIILIELLFPVFVSWIVFLVFLSWQIVLFGGTFYMVARGGWVEEELHNKRCE